MRKILCLALALCLGLTLGACGADDKASTTVTTFDEEALITDAKLVSQSMIQGDFDSVAAKFDKTMSKQLSPEALKEGFVTTLATLGEYVETVSAEGAVSDKYYVVTVIERFENKGMKVQVTYDTEGKISGLWCTYETLEAPTYEGTELSVIGDPEMPLGATLTLPEGVEKPPVVILVHGSGSNDRDETLYENAPFLDIAEGLEAQGIATLRYDKRYYVYPEKAGELGANLTLREEVLDDVDAAIALMQEDERVDGSKIYVLGHSLGGMLTPAIAAENPNLAGIISMAGSLRPLWEISYDQNQDVIENMDVEALSDADKTLLESQIAQIEADIKVLRSGKLKSLPNDQILMGIPAGYWKSLDEYQGSNFIDKITLPILVLQGDADFQVYPDKDFTLWQDTIGNRDNAEFHLYENLNHLLMPTQGKRDVSEYAVKGTVDPQVIQDIAEFIKKN